MFGIVTSHLRLVNFHIAICSVESLGEPGNKDGCLRCLSNDSYCHTMISYRLVQAKN